MQITYYDSKSITEKAIARQIESLQEYRIQVGEIIDSAAYDAPESALVTWQDEQMLTEIYATSSHFKKLKHVILVGIGGSSLGTEAIHSVLADENSPELHVLDTVSAFELSKVLQKLSSTKKAEQIAVCLVSKSGTTTETLSNAAVLLAALEEQFGKKIYQQTIFISGEGSDLHSTAKKLGGHFLSVPAVISGRYSVFTAVGLLPLHLLGHDIEAILNGAEDAVSPNFETAAIESAARLYTYLTKGVTNVNVFAFDTRLVRLGKWYRQLAAESLGKQTMLDGKPNKLGFIPTISTPVELHSMGQLYFSGWPNVYTDFISFDDEAYDFEIPKNTKLAPKLKGKSLQEIHTAIYGGVIGAYQENQLPYRDTQLDDELAYSLGLFMGMRMLETMCLAKLMNVNAFDQPNVEGYKETTRKILKN